MAGDGEGAKKRKAPGGGDGDAPCVRPSADELRRMAKEVCGEALAALAKDLDGQLAADARLCWRFAALRRRALGHVQACPSPNLYEFNNIFARFYVASRNALAPAAAESPEVLAAPYAKMQAELVEKGMEELPGELHGLKDLPDDFPGLEGALASCTVQTDETQSTYTFAENTMVVPLAVEEKLRGLAREFAAARDGDADVLADRILRVTVLNYILASSSLYWGFGPDVYQRAADIGAVLECYAHPFNHALPVFCSPCAPLDHVYGSLGSFYSESVDRLVAKLPAGAVIVANPPYLESELLACFLRVNGLVKGSLRALSIYPKWDGADGVERYKARVSVARDGFSVILEPNRHSYFDYQKGKIIPARFASLGFALGLGLRAEEAELFRGVFDVLSSRSWRGGGRKKRR